MVAARKKAEISVRKGVGKTLDKTCRDIMSQGWSLSGKVKGEKASLSRCVYFTNI